MKKIGEFAVDTGTFIIADPAFAGLRCVTL